MGRTYLSDKIDLGLPPIKRYDSEQIRQDQIDRLVNQIAVGYLAEDIPRRLGKAATPTQLAKDAKFSREFGAKSETRLIAWGIPPKKANELIVAAFDIPQNKRKAAQVVWYDEVVSLIAYLRAQIRFNATHGTHHDKTREANKIVLRLENEINVIAQAYALVYGNPITPQEIVNYEIQNS